LNRKNNNFTGKIVAPSRERGLKQYLRRFSLKLKKVAPSRERGLKQISICPQVVCYKGRSFTGAWIETQKIGVYDFECDGRSFTGAWIETLLELYLIERKNGRSFTGAWIETTSTTLQFLKLFCRSFTGAWIETKYFFFHQSSSTVAPSRERGLKL